MNKFNELLSGIVVAFAGLAACIAMRGYTFSVLWSWFVVPVFALPVLSVAQSCGIGLLAAMLRNIHASPVDSNQSAIERNCKQTCFVFAVCVFTLAVGYVVKQFA